MNVEQAQRSPQNTRLHSMRGNELLLLTDPGMLWVVQSGSLAVFAVRITDGVVEGDRHYLFSVLPEGVLLGAGHCPSQTSLGLVAVALEPTELVEVSFFHPSWVPALERWMVQLGQISGLPRPQITTLLPQTQYLSLDKGQVYQPTSFPSVWVAIQQGSACWMGYKTLLLNSGSEFPLSDHLWLEAEEHLELFIQPISEVVESAIPVSDRLLQGLAQLQIHCLQSVEQMLIAEDEAACLRFQARQQLNRHIAQTTIRNLVSVLKPQEPIIDQDPLLIAAGAIGRALGVKIEPPMKSENLDRVKEPLEAIARASHLRLRRVLLRDRWWQKDAGPILAYRRMTKHPVALLPVAGDGYQLLDPVQNGSIDQPYARLKVNEAIAATLDPIAYMFYQPLPDGVLKAIDLLKFALRGRTSDLFRIVWTGVAVTVLGMLVPQLTAVLIDQVIPTGSVELLLQMVLGLLAAAFGGASFQLAQAIASMRLETMSDASLQAAVWDRLLTLKTSFFRQYAIGDLNSRVSGISAIRRKLSGTTLQTIFTGIFSLLNLGLLFYYSTQLATLALLVAVVIVAFTLLSGVFLVRQNRTLMELEGQLFGVVVQLINGIPKLRIAGVEERAFAYWGQTYTQQLRLMLSTQYLEDVVAVFNTVLPPLTAALIFWLASTLVTATDVTSGLSVGSFLAFNVAFGTFIGGVTSLSLTLTEVLDVIPLWQRSRPILTAEPETDANKADPGPLSGSIRVDRVSFRYRTEGAFILNEVSIQAQPGEFIALVGPSGSGKSTILRLLLGFESPSSGTVYYDGQDLAGLNVAAVRRQLGVVLQNGRINSGSIFENIASGALITLDEAWTAAENSGLADDIRAMPMQMHTVISEGGTNLSGGQRQRLVIARALALKPRILLLDEATSALDNKTQAIVSQSLDKLKVTRVVVAHRLSTIRHADRIYVLEAGQVVQQGRFDELASQPGLFAQLINRQLT
ncbi:NHLP bacteriocin export ABC transporter permease/ATPase subunit [Oscillatoria sp. FACHB-1407]|nr:NHLP bacteriocin export ABC transporter permease/ATPase subunit [Oscillatoria sp. FACHB-1407]